MASILIILFLAFLAWFWLNSIRAKEIAMQASAYACKEIEAQFLDQTASLSKIRLIRTQQGRIGIERVFSFDFSRDRETRSKGFVEIAGHKVRKVYLDEDFGTTIL